MKAGAADFVGKPVNRPQLLASIRQAMETSRDQTKLSAGRDDAASRIAGLTPRQSALYSWAGAAKSNET